MMSHCSPRQRTEKILCVDADAFSHIFCALGFFYSLLFKDDGKLSSSVRGSRQLFSGFLAKNRSQAEQEMKHFFQGLPPCQRNIHQLNVD